MKFLRFVFPFLFVRNWETGEHEVSVPRLYIVLAGCILTCASLAVAYFLQLPVVYIAP